MNQKKLYVGGLPYQMKEEELHSLFADFGEIASVRIITDKVSGQSKGYGFVEMANPEDAQKALQGLNGKDVHGRTLVVSEARPPKPREFGGGGGGPRHQDQRGPRRNSFRTNRY